MKRRIRAATLSLALLGLGACATAGGSHYRFDNGAITSAYTPVNGALTDADLQSAARACDARFQRAHDDLDPPIPFKRCMLDQGWRYRNAIRDGEYDDPWHEGRTCHDFFVLGTTGTECSNF